MTDSEVVPRELTQQRLNRGYALIAGYRRDQPYSVADMLEERARGCRRTALHRVRGPQRELRRDERAREPRRARSARAGLGAAMSSR